MAHLRSLCLLNQKINFVKGRLAFRTVVLLAIAVIVIAVALYFLTYVFSFDALFLNPEKAKLIRYATCSLALCSNGVDTKQVDAVGCLEYERGKCVKSCRQIQEEFKATKVETFKDISGNRHYCGEENALALEFDSSFPIDLRSGEIQKLSRPNWVCRGFNLPFTDNRIPFSDDWQNLNGDCIEFGTLTGGPAIIVPGGTIEDLQNAIGEQCFDGFRQTIFTPLMPYKEKSDRIYPSALYLGEEFTSGEKPECEISTSGPILTGIPADFSFLFKPEGDSKKLQTISECKIKTAGEKGEFRVWSEVAINKPYLDLLPNFIKSITNKEYTGVFVSGFAKNLAEGIKEREKETYAKFNTCALVVLDREKKGEPASVQTKEYLSFSKPEKIPTAAKTGKNEVVPTIVKDDKNTIYVFYHIFEGKQSDVYYVASSDGGESWSEPLKLTDGKKSYGFASAALFKGKVYVSYTSDDGASQEILVQELGSPVATQISNDKANFDGDSKLAVFGDRLYIFWENVNDGKSKIKYRTTVDGVVWDTPLDKDPQEVPNTPDVALNPSAIEFAGKLWLAYTVTTSTKIDPFLTLGGADIHVKNTDGKNWFDIAQLSENPVSDSDNKASLAVFNNNLYLFFHRGSEDPLKNPSGFKAQIRYFKLQGTSFSESVQVLEGNYLMPSLLQVGDRLLGVILSYDSDWGLFKTIGTLEVQNTQSVSQTDTNLQEVADSITVTSEKQSYKKGETAKFTGNLKMQSGSPQGKEVRIELKFGPVLLIVQRVTTGADGNFVWEYTLPNGIASGTYEITVSYRDKESTIKFEVS